MSVWNSATIPALLSTGSGCVANQEPRPAELQPTLLREDVLIRDRSAEISRANLPHRTVRRWPTSLTLEAGLEGAPAPSASARLARDDDMGRIAWSAGAGLGCAPVPEAIDRGDPPSAETSSVAISSADACTPRETSADKPKR